MILETSSQKNPLLAEKVLFNHLVDFMLCFLQKCRKYAAKRGAKRAPLYAQISQEVFLWNAFLITSPSIPPPRVFLSILKNIFVYIHKSRLGAS